MAQSRFSPLTADLLVRKGEAAPSLPVKRLFALGSDSFGSPAQSPRAFQLEAANGTCCPGEQTHETTASLAHSHDPAKPRRVVVNLNACEFERLGLAAVKLGVTRHAIVQTTTQDWLARFARELGGACLCLQSEAAGSCCLRETPAGSSG